MNRRHLIGPAIAVLLIGATGGSLYASGAFKETTSPGPSVLAAGTVDLKAATAGTALTMTDMLPGDRVTKPVTVTNTGTLPMRYSVTSTTTEAVLAAQLDMVVKVDVTHCTDAGFGIDGTAVYGPGDVGATAGMSLIGDVATGEQAGDRTVAPSTTQVLCVQVTLPANSNNTFQGLSTTTKLSFVAEQL